MTTTHLEKPRHNPPLRQQQPYKAKPATKGHLIWVPKKLLQAQAGSWQIWIPKRVPKEAKPTPTMKKRTAKSHKRKPWQPMPDTHTTKERWIWQPKRVDNSASTSTNQPLQTRQLPQQQQTRTKKIWQKKHSTQILVQVIPPPLSILEHSRLLQIKLFGPLSVNTRK